MFCAWQAFNGEAFQFHKGAIETCTGWQFVGYNITFNSIKVRLKLGICSTAGKVFILSIP